jgi:ankyrin repeat protein
MNSESVVAFLLAQTDLTCLNDPDRDGNTPLMLAVNYGNTRVVRRLLMAGANRHICNNQGKSPLEVAT